MTSKKLKYRIPKTDYYQYKRQYISNENMFVGATFPEDLIKEMEMGPRVTKSATHQGKRTK